MEEYVFLFQYVSDLAKNQNSRYRNTQNCKGDLLEFLDVNDWFQMSYKSIDQEIMIRPNKRWKEAVAFWLQGYKREPKEKMRLLLDKYDRIFPKVCHCYKKILMEDDLWAKPSSWKTLDYLLSHLQNESSLYNEEFTHKLMADSVNMISVEGGKLLSRFLKQFGENSTWEYRFDMRRIEPLKNDAYSFREYSGMAYCVFNDEHWSKENLVIKACSDERYANLWLYTALHFVCALRQKDMRMLPVLDLQMNKDDLRTRIMNGSDNLDYAAVTEQWLFLLQMKPRSPNKTSRFQNISNVKVFVPETLREPFGKILAIALTYRIPGDELLRSVNDISLYKSFFGENFIESCGNRRFSTRRANKAYLQGIEMVGNKEGHIQGYMLASLARSHKGNIGELSEMTDAYLRDAEFAGYKPEFVLREMFDRGVFGFIPVLLLKSVYKNQFQKLPIHEQSLVVKELGLSAVQIEKLMTTVEISLIKAQNAIKELLIDESNAGDILIKIANMSADAKDDACICLREACGDSCISPYSNSCVGCGYEIMTKSTFHLLVKQYVHISERIRTHSNNKKRWKVMLQSVIIPKIQEIIESMQLLYPEKDMTYMLDVLERGIAYAGNYECGTDGGLLKTENH